MSRLAITEIKDRASGAVCQVTDVVKLALQRLFLKKTYQTLEQAVNSTNLEIGMSLDIRERILGNGGSGQWEVVSLIGVTPNDIDVVQCLGVQGLALKLRHDGIVISEQIGVIHTDSSDEARASNDAVIDSALDVQSITTILFPHLKYYFHMGIHMPTDDRNKALIGMHKYPVYLYFDQVTQRNKPIARKSTIANNANLFPENEPNRTNTALTWGTKSSQVGRVIFKNLRPINDSATQAEYFSDKTKRVGTGYFVHSGFMTYDRIITEGWHVGSYEFSYVTKRGMCEHIAANTNFIFPGGTSSDLSGLVANGTNWNSQTQQYDVTYTTDEDDEFQGFGYLFRQVYYSSFSSLACDKIQNAYAVLGQDDDYRVHYEFLGCGCEFVQKDFYIHAKNASIVIDGGQEQGISRIENVNRVYVRNRRFPHTISSDLSAGVVVQDEQTFELQNPSEIAGVQGSVQVTKGYNGLSYTRTKVDNNYKYWRVHGRIEASEFQLRKNITVNGSLTGKLSFSYINGSSASNFANSFGEVKINTVRAQATSQQQVVIDSALNVTAAVNGNYYEISKPAITNGVFVIDVDLELQTGFSSDLARTSERPDDLTFLGVDY